MSITIDVSDVEVATKPRQTLDRSEWLRYMLGERPRQKHEGAPAGRRVEQLFESDADLVSASDMNALAEAAHDAFYRHHPLVLSPDAVWFTIAQGFAHHVALNAETLRHRFVKFEGQRQITVQRADFVLGQTNPWPEVFAAFSDQIAAHVGKLRDLVVGEFSTTGPVERAAAEICVMDTFQAYFQYFMMAGCGIPSVTLLGTPDDWKSVRQRASTLGEYGLEHWTRALVPVLDQLVETSEGRVDKAFWRSFFRYESSSGVNEMTGWLVTLYPYLESQSKRGNGLTPSPYLADWERAFSRGEARRGRNDTPQGPRLSAIPSSLASAPLELTDLRDGSKHPLRFVGGIFGVTQDPKTLALAPEFGWAVVHEPR